MTSLVVQDAQAHLIHTIHPIMPMQGRRIIKSPIITGEKVGHYLVRHGVLPYRRDSIITYNGRIISDADLWRITLTDNDLIVAVATVHGGDSTGAKVLRTVLTIVATYYAGPAAEGLLGTQAGIEYALLKGVIAAAGVVLVNALVPLPALDLPTIQAAKTQQESPTYAISGGQNRARLYQPLPIVFGRNRMFPDFGSKPYTEYSGDEQLFHQVFNFGLSDVFIREERIGDTLLGAFGSGHKRRDETYIGSREWLYSSPTNVDTVAGGDLNAGVVIRTTGLNAYQIGVDISASLFYSGNGGIEPRSVTIQIRYKPTGGGTWQAVTFIAPNTAVVYQRSVEGIVYTQNDTPAATAGQVRITNSKRNPARRTYAFDVPLGQYDVEVTRITPIETDPRAVSNLFVNQIKTFQPDQSDYSGQKRVALQMAASAMLNGIVQRYNAIVSARCDIWDGTQWGTAETSNPAWWFRWFAIGLFDANGKRTLGAGLPVSRINEAEIKAWGAWCDLKGLQCNFIIDQAKSVHDVLTIIARCGRATYTWATGTLGIIYDEANKPITARFGPSNMIKDTFQVQYAAGKAADEIVATWINPAIGWKPDVVRASVPGVTNPVMPVDITLFGVTDMTQAGKEALLIAAAQKTARRKVQWEADVEGLAVKRGDVIALSHDLTQWAASGRIVSGGNVYIRLDKKVTMPGLPTDNHTLLIRAPDGTFTGFDLDYISVMTDTMTLATATPTPINSDPDHEPSDYMWFLDAAGSSFGKRLKITGIEPLSADRVRITAVDDDPLYYAAENNPFLYTAPTTTGDDLPTISSLDVTDTISRVGAGFQVYAVASWEASGNYAGAWVNTRKPGEAWRLLGSTSATQYEFRTEPLGTIEVSVVGFNADGHSDSTTTVATTHIIEGKGAPPPNVDTFLFSGQADGTRQFDWSMTAIPADHAGYIISYAAGLGQPYSAMQALHTGVLMVSPFETNQLGAGDYSFAIVAIDTSGNSSMVPLRIEATLEAPRMAGAIDTIDAAAMGWPGTLFQAVKQGTDLIADDQQTWDSLAATIWDAWQAWYGLPYPSFTYQHIDYDLGLIATFTPIATASGVGVIVLEEQHSTDNINWSVWMPTGPTVNARYLRFRATVTHAAGLARLSQMQIILSAKSVAQDIIDLDTATLTGANRIAVGHIKLPLTTTFSAIARVSLAFQNLTGTGWWWEIISKTDTVNGPEIKIHNLVGGVDTLADAVIDAQITGV